MIENLNKCTICPHECKINRNVNELGRCKSNAKIKIALVSTHNYEEPCISGKNGSGTIFFSNCNLNCVFCQNYEISQLGFGKEIEIEELAKIMIEQQNNGVQNINLVTPTSYTIQIIEAIKIAKKNGLKIPIIYNTNGYEKIETIKMLDGYVDVYLPDLKYYYDELGKKYSKVENYFNIASMAIKEMINQVGKTEFDMEGNIKKGVIIRHLVLPGHVENSKMIIKWISKNIPSSTYISVMAQFFPTYLVESDEKYSEINRKITKEEYSKIEDTIYKYRLKNVYLQEIEKNEEKYVPKWEF